MTRRINADGLALIKEFEGLRLTSYFCPAGILTIGYGSTGSHVKRGLTISEPEAERLLRDDLERFEKAVAAAVKVSLTDNQFAACVSLAYNVGTGAFIGSTLVKRLNAGRYEDAADQFPRWNRAGGKVMTGLVRRRARERELFMRAMPVTRPPLPTSRPAASPVSTQPATPVHPVWTFLRSLFAR